MLRKYNFNAIGSVCFFASFVFFFFGYTITDGLGSVLTIIGWILLTLSFGCLILLRIKHLKRKKRRYSSIERRYKTTHKRVHVDEPDSEEEQFIVVDNKMEDMPYQTFETYPKDTIFVKKERYPKK